jgi:hypothetical protein
MRTDVRRGLFRIFGEPVLFLDPHLRGVMSQEKRRAWINDQYKHPQERKHSMTEVLQWFDAAGILFVSSIPKIRGQFAANEQLFETQSHGSSIERLGAEVEMIFTHGWEGGLFIMIGRRPMACVADDQSKIGPSNTNDR